MKQRNDNVLAIGFSCPSTTATGDAVILSGPRAVKKCDAAGSLNYVGVVSVHRDTELRCTVDTRFRERRDDRVSGAAIATVGPFVWDANMKVIPYNPSNHDPFAIAGLVITTAGGAGVTVETLEL